MVAGVPCMCMSTTPAPVSAATLAISGSAERALVSLMIEAPAASASRATSALVVSTEMGIGSLLRDRLDDGDDPSQLFLERDGARRPAGLIRRLSPGGQRPGRLGCGRRRRTKPDLPSGRRRRSCPGSGSRCP